MPAVAIPAQQALPWPMQEQQRAWQYGPAGGPGQETRERVHAARPWAKQASQLARPGRELRKIHERPSV
jgi:hypothetical protein